MSVGMAVVSTEVETGLNKNRNSSDKNRNVGSSVCSGFLSARQSSWGKNAKRRDAAIVAPPIPRTLSAPFALHASEKSFRSRFTAEAMILAVCGPTVI